jgi:hypothetical protein
MQAIKLPRLNARSITAFLYPLYLRLDRFNVRLNFDAFPLEFRELSLGAHYIVLIVREVTFLRVEEEVKRVAEVAVVISHA